MTLPVVLDGNATLVSLIQPLAVRPGFVATPLPEVRVLSAFGYVASSPQIYEPSLMIVVQGSKVACLGPRTFEYGTGHYLIQALSVPFKCETFATPEKPLYGVSVAIDRVLLGELVQAMGPVTGHESQVQTPESMTSVRIDNTMRDSVERLLRCLHDPLECQAMGQARIRGCCIPRCADRSRGCYVRWSNSRGSSHELPRP